MGTMKDLVSPLPRTKLRCVVCLGVNQECGTIAGMKRAFKALALYTGWQAVGVLGAILGTGLFALMYDPHGDGPVGEGLIFVFVLGFLLFLGMIAAYIRASTVWNRFKGEGSR